MEEADQLYSKGKNAESIPLVEEALRIAEQAFGSEDRMYVRHLMENLAIRYKEEREYDQSLTLHKRLLSLDEQEYGPWSHPTQWQLDRMAELYVLQGNYAEAEPIYERLVESENRLKTADVMLIRYMMSHVECLRKLGKSEEADMAEAATELGQMKIHLDAAYQTHAIAARKSLFDYLG